MSNLKINSTSYDGKQDEINKYFQGIKKEQDKKKTEAVLHDDLQKILVVLVQIRERMI